MLPRTGTQFSFPISLPSISPPQDLGEKSRAWLWGGGRNRMSSVVTWVTSLFLLWFSLVGVAGRGSRTLGKRLYLTELLRDLRKTLKEKFLSPHGCDILYPLLCSFILPLLPPGPGAKIAFLGKTRMVPCKTFFFPPSLSNLNLKKKSHSFYVGVSVCCSYFMWLSVSRSATWFANQRTSACLPACPKYTRIVLWATFFMEEGMVIFNMGVTGREDHFDDHMRNVPIICGMFLNPWPWV